MTQSKSVNPLVPVASRLVGVGVSNGINVSALELEQSQVYVEIIDKGAAGVLDVKLQDGWVNEAGKFTGTGDEALGLNANGITRIPPDAVRGKYFRIVYEVKTNAIVFGVHFVKAED